jgi:hypothetical protein
MLESENWTEGGIGITSVWTLIDGGITVFATYQTEASYRMKNFAIGRLDNS